MKKLSRYLRHISILLRFLEPGILFIAIWVLIEITLEHFKKKDLFGTYLKDYEN